MTDEQQPTEGKAKMFVTWGISEADALKAWRKQTVEVHLTTGPVISGALVGYGPYWYTLLAGESILLVNKAAVAWTTTPLAERSKGDTMRP